MKKLTMIALTLIVSSSLLSACAHSPKKNGAGDRSALADESADGQGIGGNSPLAQGIDAGTRFSDKSKCQGTPATGGVEQHYFFAFDQSTVSPEFSKAIQNQAGYLANHPTARVSIQGNTDDRGSREYNVGLGWRRVRAVVDLLQQYGASKSQLNLTSYGAERPIAFGQTETAWRCNRRVDLVY